MPNFVAPSLPKSLIDKLSQCKSLPSLPAIALKIVKLARTPSASSSELTSLVSQDASLSAKILSTANSAFYGSKEFANLQQAINRLGMEAALSLALSFSLTNNNSKQHTNGICLDTFWKRSVISALLVRQIHQQLGFQFDVEPVFLAAILQDIGMLALNELDPQTYGVVFHSSRSHKQLVSFEEKEYGACHRQVGYWLTNHWGLPAKYSRLIYFSHRSAQEIEPDDLDKRVLAVSGLLADPWVAKEKDTAMSVAYQAAQNYLNLNEQQLNHLLIHLQDQLPKVANLFELSTPKTIDTFNLLQEAKQLLVERNLRMMQQLAQQQEELELLRKATALLQEQNKKDPLTQIYNRHHLDLKLQEEFNLLQQHPGRLAVVFIDLDYFKNLNDQYGHAVGDTALKTFASILEQELDPKCLAGRYGGEEFVVLMSGYSTEDAYQFAKRLQRRLADTALLKHQHEEVFISASMGIAGYNNTPEHPENLNLKEASALIDAADQAMYSAKNSGRNNIRIYNK